MKVNKEHFEQIEIKGFENLNHKIITTRKTLQARTESSFLQLLPKEFHLHFNFISMN